MRTISVRVLAIILKVLLWKLFDHSYAQSSFLEITMHVDSDI